MTKYPELYMQVLFVGDKSEESAFNEMFVHAGCTKAEDISRADLVIFGGGVDVSPSLYGQTPHVSVHSNRERDARDIEVFKECFREGIPMFGVCRGAQFLHVMNNGKLWQDVNEHYGDHEMLDLKAERMIRVSSVHHQMCRLFWGGAMPPDFNLIGTTTLATHRMMNAEIKQDGLHEDCEAYFYADSLCFGVQGHPEYRGYTEFAVWTLTMIRELIINHPDVELKDSLYRMKKSARDLRDEHWKKLGWSLPYVNKTVVELTPEMETIN